MMIVSCCVQAIDFLREQHDAQQIDAPKPLLVAWSKPFFLVMKARITSQTRSSKHV